MDVVHYCWSKVIVEIYNKFIDSHNILMYYAITESLLNASNIKMKNTAPMLKNVESRKKIHIQTNYYNTI